MSFADDDFEILESTIRPEVTLHDVKTDLEHRLGWVVDSAMRYAEQAVRAGALSTHSAETVAAASYRLAQLMVDTARDGYQSIQTSYAAHAPAPKGEPS